MEVKTWNDYAGEDQQRGKNADFLLSLISHRETWGDISLLNSVKLKPILWRYAPEDRNL
jgi:hypothetical protein